MRGQFKLAALLKGGSRSHYFGIIPRFNDYKSAVDFYDRIIRHAPYHELTPIALVNLAELALNKKKLGEAIDALDRLIDCYADLE
jgi:outer membrane protein assembly factor BamD (BamD/ComL family)